MIPGSGQNRGDVDFMVGQRDELAMSRDSVDRGEGYFETPVAGGSWSKRGRCVHLPDFNMPSAGVLNVYRSTSVQIQGKGPLDAEGAPQTILSYSVPAQFGLRVTHVFAFPFEWSMYPYVDSTWTMTGEAINGYDRRGVLGNDSVNMEPASFMVAGGKTLVVSAITRFNGDMMYAAGFKGYLYVERGA